MSSQWYFPSGISAFLSAIYAQVNDNHRHFLSHYLKLVSPYPFQLKNNFIVISPLNSRIMLPITISYNALTPVDYSLLIKKAKFCMHLIFSPPGLKMS